MSLFKFRPARNRIAFCYRCREPFLCGPRDNPNACQDCRARTHQQLRDAETRRRSFTPTRTESERHHDREMALYAERDREREIERNL